MSTPTLESKIRGSLIGAAIGAELGFSKIAKPENFAVEKPEDVFSVKLEPVFDPVLEKHRTYEINCRPIIDLGIRAYVEKQGRVTPEEFAPLFRDDAGIAQPAWAWDGMHTIQEILKEGMNPRISGIGISPDGHITAAMPGVGIYHFADPEYAYVDGVEIASVAQGRDGADWAGLAAAAIACSLDPSSDEEKVVETVLKLAHANNKEVFYQMNSRYTEASHLLHVGPDGEFLKWWLYSGGRRNTSDVQNWTTYNPINWVLPLLARWGQEPEKLMPLLLTPENMAVAVSPIIAGAIVGGLHGPEVFPAEWLKWAQPIAEPWSAMLGVVEKRRAEAKVVVSAIDRLKENKAHGTSMLFDKVYGCILAGAIGNAMGSPVECRFYWEIDEAHPDGVTTILEPRRLESEDDNQMAMLLVETYLQREGRPVTARHFGHKWHDDLNRQHFYTLCMGNAYDLIRKGWDARITGHWSVVTGSTVMCLEPVGIYHMADPDNAAIDAKVISYMYQRGLDVTATAIMVATAAEAFKAEATVDSICQAALRAAPTEKMRTFDERQFDTPYQYLETCLEIASRYDDVFEVRKELYDRCLFYSPIDPLELLGLALALFKIADGDVRLSAIGGTNIGRDSDTIAGRAAMLAGALRGAGNVPQDWMAMFKPSVLDRIRDNSRKLVELVADRKTELLRYRTEIA